VNAKLKELLKSIHIKVIKL